MKTQRRWIYRRKDSPYWWYTFKIKGKPRASGCTETADERLAQKVADVKRADYIAGRVEQRPGTVTFSKWLDQWLDTYKHRPSYVTKASHIREIVKFFGVTKRLADVSTANILKFKAHLDGVVKPATVNQYLGTLKTAFNWEITLNKEHGITTSPCNGISKYSEKPFERDRWLTPDEKIRLYNATPQYLLKMIIFSTKSAVRQGDLRNMKWDMINFETRFLRLPQTKEGKPRNVPLHPDCIAILKSLTRQGEYVFCNEDGSQLSRHGFLRTQFRAALERAQITNFRWHDLRHTFATWTINAGGDLKPMGMVMGHSTVKMTERYSHLADHLLRSQVNLQGSDLEYLGGEVKKLPAPAVAVAPVKFSTN